MEMATTAQAQDIHIIAERDLGYRRDAVYPMVSDMIGRRITSTKQLTRDEAHRVLHELNRRRLGEPDQSGDWEVFA